MTHQKPRSPSTPHRPAQGNKDFRNRNKRGGKSSGERKNIPHSAPQQFTGDTAVQPGIVLKPGREKSLLRRHPWVFSGAMKFSAASCDLNAPGCRYTLLLPAALYYCSIWLPRHTPASF